jgi:hypothetical protein
MRTSFFAAQKHDTAVSNVSFIYPKSLSDLTLIAAIELLSISIRDPQGG